MTRIIFADVETTHLDPQVGHIWELALIVRDPGMADAEYLWQIRPDLAGADPNALRVGGYYQRNRMHAYPMGSVNAVEHPEGRGGTFGSGRLASEVAELLDGVILVGQNAQFDAAHLTAFLCRNGQAYTAHYRPVCVTTLAAGMLAAKYGMAAQAVAELPWSSAEVARAVGVDPEDYATHTALGDARLARDLWDAVAGGAS